MASSTKGDENFTLKTVRMRRHKNLEYFISYILNMNYLVNVCCAIFVSFASVQRPAWHSANNLMKEMIVAFFIYKLNNRVHIHIERFTPGSNV